MESSTKKSFDAPNHRFTCMVCKRTNSSSRPPLSHIRNPPLFRLNMGVCDVNVTTWNPQRMKEKLKIKQRVSKMDGFL